MIKNITQISKLEALFTKLSNVQFNATLPVSIEVLDEIDTLRYLLQIGNKQISTKSIYELETGSKYWGSLQENSQNINLSKLVKKPKILQNKNHVIEFDVKNLVELLSKPETKKVLKTMILEQLSVVNSKNDFITLSNMLIGLNENIFSFFIKENQKSSIFQFRKRREPKKDRNSFEFFAAFENLGPIEGIIKDIQGIIKITFFTYYEQTYNFLKKELQDFDIESEIYHKKEKIKPLFENSKTLLDIKG